MTAKIQHKRLDQADERREIPGGRLEICTIGEAVFGRFTFQPGWRWSESVGPMMGTSSCQVRHNGYVESGRLHVRMDDGTEVDLEPGEFFVCEPGHDAWVLGDEPCIAFDFSPQIESYARPG